MPARGLVLGLPVEPGPNLVEASFEAAAHGGCGNATLASDLLGRQTFEVSLQNGASVRLLERQHEVDQAALLLGARHELIAGRHRFGTSAALFATGSTRLASSRLTHDVAEHGREPAAWAVGVTGWVLQRCQPSLLDGIVGAMIVQDESPRERAEPVLVLQQVFGVE